MKHLFLPYNLALLAKEKGFAEPCFMCYMDKKLYPKSTIDGFQEDNSLHITWEDIPFEKHLETVSAPLYQQVLDWLREKHSIWVEIILHADETKNYIQAFVINYKKDDWKSFERAIPHSDNPSHSPTCFNTTKYYIALETAIEKALKLIEI